MKTLFASLFLILFTSLSLQAQNADAILGVWNNTEKDARIEIVWLQEPTENGKPKLDKNNADKSLRNQPIMGMKLLKGFVYDDGSWEDGTIYDPKNGKTYSCVMNLKNPEVLEVRGYVGFSMLGRTVEWTNQK